MAGWERLSKAVAELRNGGAEEEQAYGRNHTNKVKGVAGAVEVTFEHRGLFASEREGNWRKVES